MRRRKQSVSSPTKKILVLASIVAAILVGVLLAVKTTSTQTDKPQDKNTGQATPSKQTTSNQQVQQLTQNQAKTSASTASAASVPPTFTVYYPSGLPAEFLVDKSTIAFSKDSFTFAVLQNDRKEFFVYEEPAGSNFSFQRLKGRLTTPLDLDTSVGSGILGNLGSSLITAVKTNKNTLIIVNCTAVACDVPSKQIVESLRINTDPTHIH